MSPPPMSADLLLRHARGLRQLARALVGDEHAAEDVLQETWLAALRRPPERRGDDREGGEPGVGAWLNGVARRLALKRRRGEARRSARERSVARAEPLASVGEELARREVLRHVVEAVLSLEEPYQTVVVLRYYEDLPPRDIAERLGCPVATVKSRLHRARQKLRDRLDGAAGERGQWALALVGVFGWDRALPAATAAGGTGAWLGGMAMEWKLALAAAGIAVVAVGVYGARDAGALADLLPGGGAGGGTAADAARDGGEAAALAAPDGQAAPQRGGRVAVAAAPEPDRVLEGPVAGPYAFALELEVVNADDLPCANARVEAAPLGHPWTHWGFTDEDGRFRMEWRGRAPAQELALRLAYGAVATSFWRVDCAAGETTRRRIAMRVGDGKFAIRTDFPHDEHTVVLAAVELAIDPLFRPAASAHEPRPGAERRFRWPLEAGSVNLRMADRTVGVIRKGTSLSLDFGDEAFELTEATVEGAERGVLVAGVVRDAGGESVPGALVTAPGAPGAPSTEADDEGRYELLLPSGGILALRAGGGDHGQARYDLDLRQHAPGSGATWDPLLDRGLELRGRLVDAEGAPLAGWTVEFVRADDFEPWHDATTTAADGSFAIPNLPDRAGALHVRAPGEAGLVAEVFSDQRPGAGAIELPVPAERLSNGAVALAVTDAGGEPARDVDVRLWQELGARGVDVGFDEDRDLFVRGGVPPGRYVVVAGAASRGFVERDVVVGPGESVELGALALPAIAPVRVEALAPETRAPLAMAVLRRTSVDSVAATGPVETAFELDLPPGDYLAYASGGDFGTPAFPFTVRAGDPAEHVLDLRGLRAVDVTLVAGAEAADGAAWRLEVLDAERRPVLLDEHAPAGTARAFLLPGAYAVRATSAAGATAERELTVGAEGGAVRVPAP